ncbi:hypothetical protein BDR04DRAFT_1154747 [Suillus decipiens]|nr:hypothetical protein BDR04DRAFT_1154747 [Suillus decipiens]
MTMLETSFVHVTTQSKQFDNHLMKHGPRNFWSGGTIFGNKWGIPLFNISDDNEDDDDLILMKKQCAKCTAAAHVQSATSVLPPVEAQSISNPNILTVHSCTATTCTATTSTPTTSLPATSLPTTSPTTIPPPPEIAILSLQQRSLPKPHPIQPTRELASMSLTSMPTSVSSKAPTPVSNQTKKCQLEELEINKLGSSLSEVKTVANSPVVPKYGRKSQKKTTAATTSKKHKGRK